MSLSGLWRKLRSIYGTEYLLLNLVILLVYYIVVQKILALQQFGFAIVTAPVWLMLSLVVSSSVLMTLAIHTVLVSRKGRALGYGEATSSCATAVVGGVLSGCGCQGTILYSALAVFAGSGEAFAVNTIFAEHIGLVLGALTIFNIVFIVYSFNRLPGGRGNERKGRKKR
jgi:hypothetical protein